MSEGDFEALSVFLRQGPRDSRATPENLRKLVPDSVPSGMQLAVSKECRERRAGDR